MGPADLLREAQQFHYSKQFDEAVGVYERIIKEFPGSKQAASAQQQLDNLRPTRRGAPSPSPSTSSVPKKVAVPPPIAFACPACRAGVRVVLPLKSPRFRCGACKQELIAETAHTDPWVIVVTARIEVAALRFSEEQIVAFQVLEIEPTIDLSEVKKAYRAQLTQYHPDRVAGLGLDLRRLAEEKTKRINAAFEIVEPILRSTTKHGGD